MIKRRENHGSGKGDCGEAEIVGHLCGRVSNMYPSLRYGGRSCAGGGASVQCNLHPFPASQLVTRAGARTSESEKSELCGEWEPWGRGAGVLSATAPDCALARASRSCFDKLVQTKRRHADANVANEWRR